MTEIEILRMALKDQIAKSQAYSNTIQAKLDFYQKLLNAAFIRELPLMFREKKKFDEQEIARMQLLFDQYIIELKDSFTVDMFNGKIDF
jgi:predicted DNA-binding protein YlxM (UPF0122 family)